MNKRTFIGAVSGIALLVAIGGTAQALIPVFDGAAVAEMVVQLAEAEKAFALQVEEYATQVRQFIGEEFSWVTQAQQYATQLQQYFNEAMLLLNFVHHPTLGVAMGMMNQVGLGNSLPFNPQSAMNLINGMSYGQGGFAAIGGLLNALSGMASSSYEQNRLYTPTDASWTSQQLIANGNGIAGSQGVAGASYADYRNHMAVLPSLRQNLLTADTTKDTLDASGQLQAEMAWNMNQLGQSYAISTMSQLQQQARTQRDEERLACELEMFRTGGGACPTGNNGALAGGGGGANGGSTDVPVPPIPPAPAGAANANVALDDAPMPTPPQPVAQPPAQDRPAPPPVPGAQAAAARP